jgi:sarcosine oxidase subunit gamma
MADLAMLPPEARFALRGDAASLAAGCAAFAVPVPGVLRAATQESRAALWLGPDEILLIAPPGTPGPDAGWPVDISERQVAFELAAPGSETLLAAGCPLDLEKFAVGQCTRTVLGKAEIVLWHRGPNIWRLEIWRSFAPYARALLEQAARDFS